MFISLYIDFLLCRQATLEEMLKRQTLLGSMKELVQQVEELTEDKELIEMKTNHENLASQWNQLSQRLTAWIQKLQVRSHHSL